MKLVPIASTDTNPAEGTVCTAFLSNTVPHAVFQENKLVYTAPLSFTGIEGPNVFNLKALTHIDGCKDDDVINGISIDSIVYKNSQTGKRITELVPPIESGNVGIGNGTGNIRILDRQVIDGRIETTYSYFSYTNSAGFIIQIKVYPHTGVCEISSVASDSLTASRHTPLGMCISVDRVPAKVSEQERKEIKIVFDKEQTKEEIEEIVDIVRRHRSKPEDFIPWTPYAPFPGTYPGNKPAPYVGSPGLPPPVWPNQYPGHPGDQWFERYSMNSPYQTVSEMSAGGKPPKFRGKDDPAALVDWLTRSGFNATFSHQLGSVEMTLERNDK